MKLFSSNRRKAAAAVAILLALFLLRPGASRLKSRIVSSISSALGRSVEIGSVHLRLLPRPGFDLENLVVYDDPAFGAEPMLRASEVTADLRLTSLVRGRLEIGRLDLTEPSLNLVHGENGRWNLEALLERTARMPLAPTAKPKSEPRPGFPYIEASSARINFKSGPEKKPYALINADFSLWQDSENTWGVRLKAQPFRTDLNLNDMGLLRVNGTWQRAATLSETPLEFAVEWDRAQLGQLTKFFTGNDQGWRGSVLIDATLRGTPAKLRIASNASVQDFRRYDITSGGSLRLGAHCEAEYSSHNHSFHEVACDAPVGGGTIMLKGDMGLPGSRNYGLMLSAENIPATAVLALAERAKKNLAEDLVVGGTVQGAVAIQQNVDSKVRFEGQGEIAEFRLSSAANKAEMGPGTIPFLVTSAGTSRLTSRKTPPGMKFPEGAHVEFGPFAAGSGKTGSPTVRGRVNRGAYNIEVAGDAEITKTLRVGRMLGLSAVQATAEGTAQLDLQIAGALAGWGYGVRAGFAQPLVTGSAKLRNVRVGLRGTGGPVEISSAEVHLSPDAVRVTKLNAKVADSLWTGSLDMPRDCGTPGACEIHFDLSANQFALSELSQWVSPGPKERPWYRVLESNAQAGPTYLEKLRASGHLSVERVQAQTLAATHVAANVSIDGGKLRITDLTADFLGGKHRGAWQADFSVQPAVCSGSGNVSGASLANLSESMRAGVANDAWMTGTANASYELKGNCAAEFWPSAEGTLTFDVKDGSFPRITLAEEGPLHAARLAGKARLHGEALEIKNAKLESASGKFELTGTASLKHEIDLKLARTGSVGAGYAVTGTLAAPRVTPLAGAETQAQLK